MSVILLASYPKSGNTWMRALLSNYLADDEAPVSINRLAAPHIGARHSFDENLGLASSIMTEDEILRHMPRYFESLAAAGDSPGFVKVHSAFRRLPGGAPLFSSSTFAGAVCIVRNPLDVAVSYAHHLQSSLDHAIKRMRDRRDYLTPERNGIHAALPELVSDWGRNVAGWLDQDELPVQLVSYEDLQADTSAVLEAVAAFAGLSRDPARLASAVEHSSFHALRAQEKADGFHEKQPTAPSFFREGRAGDWRNVLTREQVRRLTERHGAVMARLGYLDEAESFLAHG